MAAHKRKHIFTWLHVFSVLLLLGLMMPAGSASAQSGPGPDDGGGRAKPRHRPVSTGLPGTDARAPQSGPTVVGPGINLVQDPGFELYWPNPYWTEFDDYGYYVLCNTTDCGGAPSYGWPHAGSAWAWLGGSPDPAHSSGVYQSVTFPNCGVPTTLRFYLWITSDPGYGPDDVFGVFIDDTLVFMTDATHIGSYSSYQPVSIDVSSFANGAQHTLWFESYTSGHYVSFNVDDVSLMSSWAVSISGNTGIGGVDLSANGSYMTTSDGSGNYSFSLPYGHGTVTPSKAGYSFEPESYTYSCVAVDQIGQNYVAHANNVNVYIGGPMVGGHYLPSGGRVTPQYNLLNGPVQVVSTDASSVFTSQRVHNGTGFVNELMGLPLNQMTNEYWFPWYDNLTMTTWLLIGNPDILNTAHVDVTIAGNKVGHYDILPGGRATPQYPILNGPVHIVSDINVFTSERVHTGQGFVQETAGYPANQLAQEYWFPWYDNLSMTSWILVGNPDTSLTAHVHIYIAGNLMDPPGTPVEGYAIEPGGRWTPTFPVLNGPVHVVSDLPVFTSERVHNGTGFINEVMGVANGRLAKEYWFPWYDNLSMTSWILVGNPSTTDTAHVHIYIAGEDMEPLGYDIGPGGRVTPTFARLNGPVHVVSDINVFTSERVHTGQGFVNETMGYPNGDLSTEYWFPWYDNLSMTSWILVGKP